MRRLMAGCAIAAASVAMAVPVAAQTTTTAGTGATTTTAVGGTTSTTSGLGTDTSLPATGAPLFATAGIGMGAMTLAALARSLRRR